MMRTFGTAALAVLLVCTAFAQSPDRRGRIDIQKYTIDADVNPRTQSIAATAKIDFTPLDNTNDVTFELNSALSVSKVLDGSGASLSQVRNSQDFTVKVNFPSTLQKGQPAQVSISYDGKLTGKEDSPVYGITFAALHPDFGYLLYPARWFPVSGYNPPGLL